jgi:RNA polymerase sigma-70 factor (ECF subfamily)
MPSDVRLKTPGNIDRQKHTDPHEARDLALRANMAHLRRYARGLLRNAADADDLVQDCLTRMLARESGRGPVREQRRFLIVSARNLFFTRYKQRVRRSVTLSLSDMVDELGYAPTQQDRLNLRDVARGLARLPRAQREAIMLVALDELSCEQAARSLGVAVGTIQSRVHRARMALKSLDGTPKPMSGRKPQRSRRTIAA